MLDSKTLMLSYKSSSILLWDLDEDIAIDIMTEDLADNIEAGLIQYYNRLDITGDRNGIANLRNELVDLIWKFAYDEFEDNESFITLAKCTELDLIQSVHGCFTFLMENRWVD